MYLVSRIINDACISVNFHSLRSSHRSYLLFLVGNESTKMLSTLAAETLLMEYLHC